MTNWTERKHAPAPGTYLCQKKDIGDKQVKEFRFGGDSPFAFRLFIYRDGQEFRAFRNACPHYDVPLNHVPGDVFTPDGKYFLCMTHYATFETDKGLCVQGPCEGETMERIPLHEDGDSIVIAGKECRTG